MPRARVNSLSSPRRRKPAGASNITRIRIVPPKRPQPTLHAPRSKGYLTFPTNDWGEDNSHVYIVASPPPARLVAQYTEPPQKQREPEFRMPFPKTKSGSQVAQRVPIPASPHSQDDYLNVPQSPSASISYESEDFYWSGSKASPAVATVEVPKSEVSGQMLSKMDDFDLNTAAILLKPRDKILAPSDVPAVDDFAVFIRRSELEAYQSERKAHFAKSRRLRGTYCDSRLFERVYYYVRVRHGEVVDDDVSGRPSDSSGFFSDDAGLVLAYAGRITSVVLGGDRKALHELTYRMAGEWYPGGPIDDRYPVASDSPAIPFLPPHVKDKIVKKVCKNLSLAQGMTSDQATQAILTRCANGLAQDLAMRGGLTCHGGLPW